MAAKTTGEISPFRIMVITLAGIFLAEIIAMIVVYLIRPQPYILETLIDASIMLLMIFPMVYYLSYRPLLTNINQRKQVENALLESNEFLERMFSLTHVLLAYMDADFNFIRVNRAYAEADGRDPDFYIGKNHFELFPNPENETIFREVVRTGKSFSTYAKAFEYTAHPERGVSYWDWSLIPTKTGDGRVTGVVLSLIDVTTRVQAELARLESERRFRAIFDQTFQFIALLAPDGVLLEINQTALDFIGRERSAMVGLPIWEALTDNVSPQTKKRFQHVVQEAARGNFIRYEGEMTGKESEVIVVDYSLKPVMNDRGEVSLIIAEGRDITDRKSMEKALEQERQRLYALLDNLPAFVALQSLDYSVRFANNHYRQRFGDPDGNLCYQVMFGFAEPCPDCQIPEIVKTNSPQVWEKTYPDGKSFRIYGYPFYDTDHTPMVLELGVDITENKQAQAKIRRDAARAIVLAETIESILEVSPDYQSVLDQIAQSTAGLIGDGCIIRLVSEDRSTHRAAAFHHINRQTDNWLSERLAGDVQPIDAGESGQVIRTGQPLFLPQVERGNMDSGAGSVHPTCLRDHELHSLLCTPLEAQGEMLGTITLFRDETKRSYSQEDLQFAHSLAHQASLAIQNARLFEAELKTRETAEVLRAASLALTQSLDLTRVMESFLDYADQLAPYERALVYLFEGENQLSLRAERGPGSLKNGATSTLDLEDEPIIQNLLTQKKSILIADGQPDSMPLCLKLDGDSPRSWVGIPLIVEENAIGVCIFEKSKPKAFSDQHVQLLEGLVGQVTVIIQNAWLFEQVRGGRERLQSLSRRLVEVQESERRYVARELHDEASQALTSLMVGLRLIERYADDSDSVLAGAADLKLIAEGVIDNLHRLAMDLRPASLDHLGLVAALRQHAEAISDQHNLVVQFEAIGIGDRLTTETETAIYRVVQEALSNVILHAQAARVDIILERRGSSVIAIVEDNGIGFDPLEVAQANRLGLVGMQERVDMLGGSLTVESQPGAGTTLFVEVPYGD